MFKDNEQFANNGRFGAHETAENFYGNNRQVILSPDLVLSQTEKLKLSHELTLLTAQGFMRDISSQTAYKMLFQDVFNHVVPCDRLSVYRSLSGEPVAFLAAGIKEYEGQRIYHLEGIIVDPNLHGKGFAHEALKRELVDCKSDILTFHTQSRLMEKLGSKVSGYDINLSRDIANLIGTSNFVDLPEGPIDRGRYGGNSLYDDTEKFDSIAIKRPDFNYLNGDAIIFAGRVNRFDVK